MIKRERDQGPTELESFAIYFVRRAEKLAEKMEIQKKLDLNRRESSLAAIFLAERIAKANQYYYLQQGKRIFPAPKGILAKIVEKIFSSEQELTNLACKAFEQASKTITEEELKGPRGQAIYLAINDLSARINQENDFWQGDKHPLTNYQLKGFDLHWWGIKWRGKLEEIKEGAEP